MNKQYVNPRCGCPHPEEEHGGCAAGPYCNHKDCRCVDGTYYGKMGDPASLAKVREELMPSPVVPTRNSELLKSFTEYCQQYPDLRFWQALRNWAEVDFILFSNFAPQDFGKGDGWLKDTFYMEKKNG